MSRFTTSFQSRFETSDCGHRFPEFNIKLTYEMTEGKMTFAHAWIKHADGRKGKASVVWQGDVWFFGGADEELREEAERVEWVMKQVDHPTDIIELLLPVD